MNFFRRKNVFNLLVTRQIDLDQVPNKEAAWFREASQVSGGDASLPGCLDCVKGNQKEMLYESGPQF